MPQLPARGAQEAAVRGDAHDRLGDAKPCRTPVSCDQSSRCSRPSAATSSAPGTRVSDQQAQRAREICARVGLDALYGDGDVPLVAADEVFGLLPTVRVAAAG